MAVKDFRSGDVLEGIVLLLKKFEVRIAKNNSTYADMTLADKSGEIAAKYWNLSEDKRAFEIGQPVRISAAVETYREKPQLRITDISIPDKGEVDMSGLVDCAPYPPQTMYDEIAATVSGIGNKDIREIALAILNDSKEKLLYYPAGKSFHHAIRSGLLYHTYTMMNAAKAMCRIYDNLDSGLLYAGVALHDIGKLDELNGEESGVAESYSMEGKLLGHISIGVKKVHETGLMLGSDPEIMILLEHMILSHHFEPEYGSPVKPMFPEAEMLHHLDLIDSRMDQFRKTEEETPEKSFSDNVWILDKRNVYNHAMRTEDNK